MKKGFLLMILVGMTAVCAQAQKYDYFAGGKLGFDYNASKNSWGSDSQKGSSTTIFELSPMMGKYLSENLGVGLMFTIGSRDETTQWGFSPFLRYTMLKRGDFSILAGGNIGVYGASKGFFGFGIEAEPFLSYSLTPRINLEVSSGLARFGFHVESRKSGEYKTTTTSFGFGFDSSNFFSSPYQIGLIYNFNIKK